METKHIYLLGRRVIDMFYGKGFSDINIQFESGPAKDDEVIGVMFYAKICAFKDRIPQDFDVVIKCAPVNESLHKTMPIKNLFVREILYYTKIVPIYDNLQDQFELCVPQEMRCLLPKCYGSCNDFKQEMIILQDLTKNGFRAMALKNMDYAHAAIILRTTAKLHALSFIYEERYPKRFREMADQFIDDTLKPNDEYDDTCMSMHAAKVMKQFTNAITDISLRKRCELVLGTNVLKKIKEIQKVGKVKTILHGDNWHSNYMFKYKDGKPTEAIPINFQRSRYGSIAYDLMYLFSFSIAGELRRNFHQLVDEYYTGFKGFLTLCGYDANDFCSYEQFQEELRIQALSCLVYFMIASPFFKNPGLTLPELLSSPELYAVTEDYKLCVNDMVTTWEKLGFI